MSRIERIEGFRVTAPIDPPRAFSAGTQASFDHIVLRITDSDGVRGYGDCVPIPGARGMLETLGRELLGQDPIHRERLVGHLRRWYVSGFALSAFSIALDDLVARRLDVPIHALYGGAWRDRARPYAASYGSIPGRELESWLAEANGLRERGFRAMKLRLGVLPAEDEAAALEALRAQLPDEMELIGDGNGGFGPTNAREMGHALEELGFLWFEEPLPMEGYVGYPELAAELAIPLAGGELTQSRPAALSLFQAGAVDIVQPDPAICGGIGEVLFIASLARLHARLCIPHTVGSQIGVAAGLQALACLPDQTLSDRNELLFLEYPALADPVQLEIVRAPIVPVDGWVPVPKAAGLGIEIDDAALERLAVEKFAVA
jgi:D-galactarolactone cycloisomerase